MTNPAILEASPDQNQTGVFPGRWYEGGFYGGRIRVGTHIFAIVWAPVETGHRTGVFASESAHTNNAQSSCDSMGNTRQMARSGSEIALWAMNLDISGKKDWCIPARDVLELAYRHLKPTSHLNSRHPGDGVNYTSLPRGSSYTPYSPGQTSASAFIAEGPQTFTEQYYISSTLFGNGSVWAQHFWTGAQGAHKMDLHAGVRAVRLHLLD